MTWMRLLAASALLLGMLGPLSAEEGGDASIRVSEFGVGTGVKDRTLEGRAESFPEGEQVWFWTRVEGGAAGDRIQHVWLHDGKEVSIGLTVGGPAWRTWSNKTLHPGSVGEWAVEVRDSASRVLARQEFRCTPRD